MSTCAIIHVDFACGTVIGSSAARAEPEPSIEELWEEAEAAIRNGAPAAEARAVETFRSSLMPALDTPTPGPLGRANADLPWEDLAREIRAQSKALALSVRLLDGALRRLNAADLSRQFGEKA